MEKSPSPVYGARLELVYGLIAHRGFESLLLRQEKLGDDSVSKLFVLCMIQVVSEILQYPLIYPLNCGKM